MLRKLDIQLVDRLRSTRADGNKRGRVIEGTNGYGVLLLLDLALEETDATGHFVDAANLADEGALERIDVWVQLRREVSTLCKV